MCVMLSFCFYIWHCNDLLEVNISFSCHLICARMTSINKMHFLCPIFPFVQCRCCFLLLHEDINTFFPLSLQHHKITIFMCHSAEIYLRKINFMILHYIKFTFISKCHTFLLHSSQSHYYRFVCIHFRFTFFLHTLFI